VDLKTAMERIYKPTTILLGFWISFHICSYDGGHADKELLILQSCTNSPKILMGLCSERSGTICDDVHESVIIKIEVADMDIKVEEMSVVKVEEDAGVNIKQWEIPVVRFEVETLVDAKKKIFIGM
jgi:hypothetical protein